MYNLTDYGYCPTRSYNSNNDPYRIMVVPIEGKEIEVPVIADSLVASPVFLQEDPKEIIIKMETDGNTASFKSLERNMEDVLRSDWKRRLLRIAAKEDGENVFYYGSRGTIFDMNFKPVMMCLWRLKRRKGDNGFWYFTGASPVLRIDPEMITILRTSQMARYIINKIAAEAVVPSTRLQFYNQFTVRGNVKIEIDKCPFKILKPEFKDANKTDKELRQDVFNGIQGYHFYADS